MHTRTGLIATTFAAVALLSGCGNASSQQQPGQGGGCRSGHVTVTEADNGKTLCVTPGATVGVVLQAPGTTTTWSAVTADSDVLMPLNVTGPGPTIDPGDVAAFFTAKHPGVVHLSSSRPACGGNGHVKCHAVLGFEVTVTVEQRVT